MTKKTNLDNCKFIAKSLFDAVEIQRIDNLPIVSHPFTTSDIQYDGNGFYNIIDDIDGKDKFRKKVFFLIDKSEDFSDLWGWVEKPYKLTFLKYCEPYMSKKDFDFWFGETWTYVENPNNDTNVPLSLAVRWFRKSNKNYIMDKSELETYNSLPDTLTVYRGVSAGRVELGLSWTDDYEVAKWFGKRYNRNNNKGYILKADISKDDVLCYFGRRDEKEIVVDVFSIKDDIERLEL